MNSSFGFKLLVTTTLKTFLHSVWDLHCIVNRCHSFLYPGLEPYIFNTLAITELTWVTFKWAYLFFPICYSKHYLSRWWQMLFVVVLRLLVAASPPQHYLPPLPRCKVMCFGPNSYEYIIIYLHQFQTFFSKNNAEVRPRYKVQNCTYSPNKSINGKIHLILDFIQLKQGSGL